MPKTSCAGWMIPARVLIDNRPLGASELDGFVRADGFDSHQAFFEWFCPNGREFEGQLVRWRRLKGVKKDISR